MDRVRLIIALKKIFICFLSNMNLKIKSATVGYNNEILVSDSKFSLGKNGKVNTVNDKS